MKRQSSASRIVRLCGLLAVVSGFWGVVPARGDLPNGPYQFIVPLAPRCLNGSFPATITGTTNSISGTLTLTTDSKGVIHGQWSRGGSAVPVVGKLAAKAGVFTVTLAGKITGKTNGGTFSFKGTVHDPLLSGPIKGTHALTGLTGTLTVDLSSAAPLAAGVLLNLTTNLKGSVSGSGTVVICDSSLPIIAKGKASATKTTLTLTSGLFSFNGTGAPQGTGFLVGWKTRAAGLSRSGTGLLIAFGPDEHKDSVVAPLPTIVVDPPSPAGGSTATVTVNAPTATQITLTASGQGCGGFTTAQQSGPQLVDTQTVGAFGSCTLVANVQTASGTAQYETSFTVQPTTLQLPALEVQGGVFVPGALPPPSATTNAPGIATVDAPGALINGGTAQLRIHLADPTQAGNIQTVFIHVNGATGFDGYWSVPAVVTGSTVIATVRLDAETAAPSSARARARFETQQLDTEDIDIELLDIFGDVGADFSLSLPTQAVGTGNVQVSLSWDTLVDLDLHVVDPTGEEIYYGNRISASGGQLDLDSEAACSIDGVNNENIVWATNAPTGEYIVRVDFWEDCQHSGANYTVTTKFCGQVETFTGSFAPDTDDEGGLGSGVEVTRFTVNCGSNIAARVRGTATYEDFAQTPTGLAATATMLPIRFAKLEVRRAADDAVLATGDTKQDGTFDVQFTNDGTPGYYVVVMAQQDNDMFREEVHNSAGQIYSVRSDGTINEQTTPDETDLAIQALATPPGAAAGSGPAAAFNIFDLGILGQTFLRSASGNTPPLLHWLWTKGQHGTCNGAVSCYSFATDTISVLSDPADPDEYDDLVLLHEFGHYFQHHFGRDDSPGGQHSICQQKDPRLAWSEGAASWFGCYVKGTSLYLDTNPTGVGVRFDIENLSACVPLGTSDNTQTGMVSEARVAGILWDLCDDDAATDPKDTVANPNGVFGAISYLGSSLFSDRGVAGADLVDFLDGWFCVGNDDKGTLTNGVMGVVIGKHGFQYDFAGPNGTCR